MKYFARSIFGLTLISLLTLPCLLTNATAAGDWFHISGDVSTGKSGIYPTAIGQPGLPGARQQAVTWVDSADCLWMFGGRGFGESTNGPGSLSDIWKFDPATNTCYWMGGSKNINSAAVYPVDVGGAGAIGARYGATSWKDNNGNIWVFGGVGTAISSGRLNDMWMLNSQTLEWTYQGGPKEANDPGNYVGIQQPGTPAARYDAAGIVTQTSQFLLFGGTGINYEQMNDLWSFDPNTRIWIWLGGHFLTKQTGIYPSTIGATGYPGARSGMAYFSDASRNLWIFGGYGYGNQTVGLLNDLWRYDPYLGSFFYVGGSQIPAQNTVYPANYGQTGTMGSRNQPCFWSSAGKLWISGGYGTFTGGYTRAADLWSFSPAENQWRFVDGQRGTSTGSYPTGSDRKGTPEGRMSGLTWSTPNRLYLFGGSPNGSVPMSDFWFHHTSPNSGIFDWQLLN